jgi:long-chain acyl-CoA synthetase
MIPTLLDRTVATSPDKPALIYADRTLDYRAFDTAVTRMARGLHTLGVTPRTVVALLLPNTPWHPVTFFAVLRLGGIVVHLSPLDADRELLFKLSDSGARLLVTTDRSGLAGRAEGFLASGIIDTAVLAEDAHWVDDVGAGPPPEGWISAARFLRQPVDRPLPEVSSDINVAAVLQYTGGTTGEPKAAILTHANLTAAVSMYEAWSKPQGLLRHGEESILCVLPLFHIYALTAALLVGVANAARIVLHPRFDVETVISDIERRRITVFAGVPTMWIAIANHPGVASRDFSSLRAIRSGGAGCPIEIEARIKSLTGLRLGGGWGMTETAPAGSNIPTEAHSTSRDRPGTIGLPLPGVEMQIVALDDPARVLAAGEQGEIRVRGPNVVAAYHNRAEASRTCWVDGWLLTGDIGTVDADGYFFLVDRKKDMIVSGGFNVYPRAIEEALYEHPSVAEALVIGVPDPYRGEAAKAFVALRPGHPTFTLEALRAFLGDKVGRHELPAHLEFRATLPRTGVGKLSKRALIDEERSRREGS